MMSGWLFVTNSHSQALFLSANGDSDKETKILDSLYYQRAFNDFASLQKETDLIKINLIKLGYIESELIELKKQNDSTYSAHYNLNNRYNKIRLYFDESLNRNIFKTISTNIDDNYIDVDIINLEQTLKLLNSEISNQGDPFSTLQLTNIKKLNNEDLYANLIISEQIQKRIIDSIIIKGYEKFPKSFVKRYLKIKTKQPFNLKDIKDKTAELETLSFASQIKEPEVLFTKDSTLLYIYVEKQKSNAFEGFLGFGSNAETSKIEFNGYLNLNLVNNLNYGESFKLIYKSDESEQKTFDVNARLPYILGSPIGVDLGLNIFKKDSTFITVSQAAKLHFQINPKNLISLGIDATTSTYLLKNTSAFIDDYKSKFYNINYSYIIRQRRNLLFPINFHFDFLAGVGTRTFEAKEDKQEKFGIDIFKIFNLNEKNSAYIRITSAILNSDTYLQNELFRFGGINSIRGFQENSLYANMYSVLNTEYRYKLNNSLYIHSILDVAHFENKLIETKEKLFGFGFGFGLITKAGLFKFNYSNGKSENQSFKLGDSKIHLSLTASF